MRNSLTWHNLLGMLAAATLPLLVCAEMPAQGEADSDAPFAIGSDDTVVVRAETAWEDTEPDVVHFRGDFEMRVRDWRLTATSATVRGDLEDPSRVELTGAPARLDIVRDTADGPRLVQAEAVHIVYDREVGQVTLDGDARVTQGDSVLHSERIEYEPATDRVQTAGRAGIRFDPN